MSTNPNDKIFVVNETTNTAYGGVDPTGQFQTIGELKGYKSYVAILNQKGSTSFIQTLSSGALDPLRTYEIIYNSQGMDFTNVGAPNNNVGTFFVATGGFPKSWGADEGEEDILQANTAAPNATVLENTIGNIWFEYNDVGYYSAKSIELFPQGKTTVSFSPNGYIESPDDIYSVVISFGNSNSQIDITSYYNYNSQNEAMNYAGDAMIEIRVYD